MKIERPPFPYEQFKASLRALFPCAHTSQALCANRDPRGRWLVRKQCGDCGKLFRNQLPHSAAGEVALEDLPPCDLDRADEFDRAYYSAARERADLIAASRTSNWWRQYSTYLESDEWAEKSRAAIEAAGGVCSFCASRPATQAHHLTYERVGEEEARDLAAVCRPCHVSVHPHMPA